MAILTASCSGTNAALIRGGFSTDRNEQPGLYPLRPITATPTTATTTTTINLPPWNSSLRSPALCETPTKGKENSNVNGAENSI